MDNREKKDRQISIILNGEEKSHDELKRDRHVYEQLLDSEIAATSEMDEDGVDFPWQLAESDPKQSTEKIVDLGERRRDKQKLSAPYWDDGKSKEAPKIPIIKRKKKQLLKLNIKEIPLRIMGIILAAVIVGISFGFMMLTIFTGDNGETVSTSSNVEGQPVAGGSVTIDQKVPMLAVEVVQGGAYSLVAKGREMAQLIKGNGYAAALTNTTDPVHLLIGVGLDREQATVISEKYLANGQEVYLKPYAVTSSNAVGTENQALFLQTGVDLYQQLTLLSVNALANGGSLLTEETMAELTTTYQKFQALKAFTEHEQQQLLAIAFQDALSNAYQQMQRFASNENLANSWQAQQFLLNGLIAYEELINTI